jgi:hypothetical protein
MATLSSKPDSTTSSSITKALEAIRAMQHNLHKTDARLQQVEEAAKSMAETHKMIDVKLNGLYKVMQQWNSSSESGSQERPQRPFPNPPSPHQPTQTTLLTADELAFLRKQEVAGKISLHQEHTANTIPTTHDMTASASHPFHMPEHNHTPQTRIVYTQLYPEKPPNVHQNPPKPYQPQSINTTIPQPNFHAPKHPNHHTNSFNLSITRPKLDFPSFSDDEPVNWLRLCEKYFALAGVPTETWVPLVTLHCHGMAQTWWRSLRTPANFLHWGQFCNMVFRRFSRHNSHSSLERFHHLKQSSLVADYIQKFEELMALMRMEHPGLTEQYFISNFIAGLKDGNKHYLVPHSPQTLSDTY